MQLLAVKLKHSYFSGLLDSYYLAFVFVSAPW